MEYPDIEAACKKIGAPPSGTRLDKPLYTAPAIVDPNTGAVISESFKIALYLDKQYPDTPRLFPEGSHALQSALVEAIGDRLLFGMFPVQALDIVGQFTPRAQEWFRESRRPFVGELEALVPQGEKKAEAVKNFITVLDDITRWIEQGGQGGLFVGGDKPTHVDTVIAATLTTIERVAGNGDLWKAIVVANGGRWGRFFKAFEQWSSVAH